MTRPDAVHRLVMLQDLTSATSRARTEREVARAIATHGTSALGAIAGCVWIGRADVLELVGFHGVPAEFMARYERIVLAAADAPPAVAVFTQGTALWVETEADYARVSAPIAAQARAAQRVHAFVALPLVADDAVLGVVTFSFTTPHAFDVDERAYVTTLAHLCTQALVAVRRYEDERRHREQVEALRHEAEAANRAKDEFLAMLGHELRNPLAPIVNAVELMALDPSAAPRWQAVIERQVHHLQRLVDDLLDVARITRGALELRRDLVAIDDVIRRALELASPLIDRKRHRVHLDLAPGIYVDGDAVRLVQVLANLIANAAKFTPPGGEIAIGSSLTGGRVGIVITDSGAGIPAELVPRMFDAFVQGPQPTDRADGGLGVGLAIVRHLVQLHHGTVVARNRARGGTELVLELPVAERHASAAAAATRALEQGTYEDVRVLLVDDNVDAAELLAEMLRLHGCEVRIAHDAPAALAIAASFPADLALLDIGLPGIDGYELATRLRALPQLSAIRIAALTGYSQPADAARSREAGFVAHFAKPLALDRLEALLASLRTS